MKTLFKVPSPTPPQTRLAVVSHPAIHQQPEVNYLPRFSPQLISLERYTLSVYRAGEIDLFENLDIVHLRLLVDTRRLTCVRAKPHSQPDEAAFPFRFQTICKQDTSQLT